MKNFLLIIIVIFFPINCFSQEIAIVDIDYLFNNSKKGKQIQNNFDKLEKNKLDTFKKKEMFLKEKEKKNSSQKKCFIT